MLNSDHLKNMTSESPFYSSGLPNEAMLSEQTEKVLERQLKNNDQILSEERFNGISLTSSALGVQPI